MNLIANGMTPIPDVMPIHLLFDVLRALKYQDKIYPMTEMIDWFRVYSERQAEKQAHQDFMSSLPF